MSDTPRSRSPRVSRPLSVRRTPARDAATRFLPQAIANRWTSRQLADHAGCDLAVACDVLAKASEQIQAESQKAIGVETQKLAQEARKARTTALGRLERLGRVVDKLTDSLEAKGAEASAKDVHAAVKAAKDLWKHTEELTGLDVAKAAAAKQAAAQEGTPTAWDGCAALEASPVAID